MDEIPIGYVLFSVKVSQVLWARGPRRVSGERGSISPQVAGSGGPTGHTGHWGRPEMGRQKIAPTVLGPEAVLGLHSRGLCTGAHMGRAGLDKWCVLGSVTAPGCLSPGPGLSKAEQCCLLGCGPGRGGWVWARQCACQACSWRHPVVPPSSGWPWRGPLPTARELLWSCHRQGANIILGRRENL